MSWAKLSDDYSDDCWTLSNQAFRLHTEALVWNGRKLLDCSIPKDDVRRFAKHPEAAAELVAVGWWTDEGDVYVLRHHAQYQRTREAVVNQQAANAKNGAKGGRPKKPREQASDLTPRSTETHSLSESLSETGTERDRTGQEALRESPDQQNGFSESEPVAWVEPAGLAEPAGDPWTPATAPLKSERPHPPPAGDPFAANGSSCWACGQPPDDKAGIGSGGRCSTCELAETRA